MNVSRFLIQQMVEDKCLRELAVLIKLKSIYGSGCVHNYTPTKLAKSSHLSRNSIKKYVDFYLSLGYARMEGDNLIFTNFEKVYKSYKHAVTNIDTALPIKKIMNLFARDILVDKLNKFNHKRTIKVDLNPKTKKGALKAYKKAVKAFNKLKSGQKKLPSATANYSVSIKTIAKHFNCSVGKAQGIVDSLCNDNLLIKTKRYLKNRLGSAESISRKFESHLKRVTPGAWVDNGFMFQNLPNSYSF